MTTATTDNGLIVRQGLDTTAYEPKNLSQAVQMATVLAKSGLLGKLEPKPETVLFLMARGRELGFSTAQSIDAFHILDGKPSLTAQAKVALCKRRRDVCEYIINTESTERSATWETKRVGDPKPQSHTFTMADAVLLELNTKDNWKKQPKTMLRWRAATGLIGMVYPDLVLGLYDPEELAEIAMSQGRQASDETIRIIDSTAVDTVVVEAGETYGNEPDDADVADDGDALASLAANPTPDAVPGVTRPWQEGDACPECKAEGRNRKFKPAKGGPRMGELQCSYQIGSDWMHHSPPAAVLEPGERTYTAGSDCPFCIELGSTTKNGNPARYFLHEGVLVCTGVDADGGAYAHRIPGEEPEKADPIITALDNKPAAVEGATAAVAGTPAGDEFMGKLDAAHEAAVAAVGTPPALVGPHGEMDVDPDDIPFRAPLSAEDARSFREASWAARL